MVNLIKASPRSRPSPAQHLPGPQFHPAGFIALIALLSLAGYFLRSPEPPPAPPAASPLSYDVVDQALGRFELARIAFNVPSEMQLAETRTVDASVSLSMTADQIAARLPARDDAVAETGSVKISDVIEVRLVSSDGAFAVVPLTPGRQAIGRATPTDWRWDITAKEDGQRRLYLTVDTLLRLDGREILHATRAPFERSVFVKVSAWQRLARLGAENWRLLITLAFAPPITYFVSQWWRKRRAQQREDDGV